VSWVLPFSFVLLFDPGDLPSFPTRRSSDLPLWPPPAASTQITNHIIQGFQRVCWRRRKALGRGHKQTPIFVTSNRQIFTRALMVIATLPMSLSGRQLSFISLPAMIAITLP